ncbi:hypothetical protein [Deinococcus koreensis]|uniref:Uncharacterized protein n=1 Tax=Deinococcus koreensis TaxID=2054903 RepID=A0A2K3UUA8_9DEIO|nr:hypothetical protein [Deinococcus koreensis]PNY80124.1 hypothetical protein CVO96_01025 [Deinococcus koreensis]
MTTSVPSSLPSSALPQALEDALGRVQRAHERQRRRAALRRGLAGLALTLLGLGMVKTLNLAPLPLPLAGLLAAGVGVCTGLVLLRAPRLTRLDAARLSDRRAALDGLLTTALTLPGTARSSPVAPASSGAAPWEAALSVRVLAQAQAAAPSLHAARIVPPTPRRAWSWPAGLLGLALLVWLLPPLPRGPVTATVPPAAVVGETTPSQASPAAGPTANPAGAPIVNEPEPEAAGASADLPAAGGRGPGTSAAPVSDAASGAGRARGPASPGAPAASTEPAARLREARQAVGAGAEGATSSGPARGGQRTQDTPFGSRESGEFRNQSVTSPDRLASAPYDPSTAPGARPMQQKSDPGSSGLRSASGGRGIESEGADKCVEGCLTNDDMNRGAQPAAGKPRAPGGETASGTSDSGSGAAGSSSGVGLGVGELRAIESRVRADLGAGESLNADRIQVLAAPQAEAGPGRTRTDVGARWLRSPEPPAASASIPDSARATVRAYFERGSDRPSPVSTSPAPTPQRTSP